MHDSLKKEVKARLTKTTHRSKFMLIFFLNFKEGAPFQIRSEQKRRLMPYGCISNIFSGPL